MSDGDSHGDMQNAGTIINFNATTVGGNDWMFRIYGTQLIYRRDPEYHPRPCGIDFN
jgi:hypothetical protein